MYILSRNLNFGVQFLHDAEDRTLGHHCLRYCQQLPSGELPRRECPSPVLKLGQYPMPRKMVEKMPTNATRSWSSKTATR